MQHAAWVIPPLVLICVLTLSAAAKAGKGESLHSIIANLRLPKWILPTWLAPAIPGIEVTLALGLVAPWRSVFVVSSGATLILMGVYWLLIARGLTINPRPSCGCFGQVGDHRITARTLARNSLLVTAAAASVALGASGRTLWSLVSEFTSGDAMWLGLAVLATGLAILVVGTSSTGPSRDFRKTEPPKPVESSAPNNEDYVRSPTPKLLLHDRNLGPITLLELSATRAQLLVFVDCYCPSTTEVADALENWQRQLNLVDVRMVFSQAITDRFGATAPDNALIDHAGLTWQSLSLQSSPSALLLGADGFLAGGPVAGHEAVWDFVDEVVEVLREVPVPDVADAGNPTPVAAEAELTGDR